ncbi:hypothetical protein OSB04_029415 [Centaurea solstitialis]|uniref:DUF4218 domain-containing protein n=1 Tax=Centaurea solstitialis TaxID=347529 RepID=A0AA38SHH6_9ASTR|nr:hypothetical protein OSB04_029415 [Centaurea solstitialis]
MCTDPRQNRLFPVLMVACWRGTGFSDVACDWMLTCSRCLKVRFLDLKITRNLDSTKYVQPTRRGVDDERHLSTLDLVLWAGFGAGMGGSSLWDSLPCRSDSTIGWAGSRRISGIAQLKARYRWSVCHGFATDLNTFDAQCILHVDDLVLLQIRIIETMCKLEMVFPSGFFDSIEHLVIHLTCEAILYVPVQYHWMYLYES